MKKFRALLVMLCCFLTLGVFSYHADNYLANENKKEIENKINSLLENRKNNSVSNLANENIDFSEEEIDETTKAFLESANVDIETVLKEMMGLSIEIEAETGNIVIDNTKINVNDFSTYDYTVEEIDETKSETSDNMENEVAIGLNNVLDLGVKTQIYWDGFDISAEACKWVFENLYDIVDMTNQVVENLKCNWLWWSAWFAENFAWLTAKATSALHALQPYGSIVSLALTLFAVVAGSVIAAMFFAGFHGTGVSFRWEWHHSWWRWYRVPKLSFPD